MPFIPGINVIQLTASYSWQSQIVENVHYIQKASAVELSDLDGAMDTYDTWRIANLLPLQATQCSAYQLEATDLTTEFAITASRAAGAPLAGTNTSGSTVTQNTIALSWRTGLRGKSFRGRTYHIGLAENMRNGNDIDSTAASDLLAAYESLRLAMPASGPGPLVVASRVSLGVPRTAILTTEILSVQLTDHHLDSQRRRLTGRGR